MAIAKQDPQTPDAKVALVPASPRRAVTPIFDEVRRLAHVEDRQKGGETHTFGEWARAKGVKPDRLLQLIREKKLQAMEGDGPEMTEVEFEKAVDFRLENSFGQPVVQSTHIPAELARGGAPLTAEQQAAAEDAAKHGRKV